MLRILDEKTGRQLWKGKAEDCEQFDWRQYRGRVLIYQHKRLGAFWEHVLTWVPPKES